MKKQNNLKLNVLIIFGLCLTAVYSCKKEQPSMSEFNENCDCANEVTANFYMEELATPIDFPYDRKSTDTDTVYADKNVWFHPVELNAGYTWYIGAEMIEEEDVYRNFGEEHTGQTYPISLVVRKKPNRICFPNDDGYDSIVRYITIVEKYNSYAFFNEPERHKRFEGDFRMKDSRLLDSIDIHVDITPHIEGTSLTNRFVISGHNFYEELDAVNFGTDGKNYKQFWLGASFCYGGYAGIYIHRRLDGVFELKMTSLGASCSTYHFFGRKLN